MRIKFLLAVTALFCGATPVGAQEADNKTGTSAEANAAPPTSAVQPKAAPKSAATSKPQPKPKAKAKTKKRPSAKSKKPPKTLAVPDTEEERAAIAAARQQYKQDVAAWIGKTSAANMHEERPQALLRSVVVLEFSVNAEGKVVKSAVKRSNRDRETEEAAMASLKKAAPLPKPPAILVRQGPVEMRETWLFNTDGRFQIRSTAQKQMDH